MTSCSRVFSGTLADRKDTQVLSFRSCSSETFDPEVVRSTLHAAGKQMLPLGRIDVMDVGLTSDAIVTAFGTSLPALSCFKQERDKSHSESDTESVMDGYEFARDESAGTKDVDPTLLPELNLAGNDVNSDGLRLMVDHFRVPLLGVAVLNLSSTLVCDLAMGCVGRGFPCLVELHLHDTHVEMTNALDLLDDLRQLQLLNLDRTLVFRQGAVALQKALKERTRRECRLPMEIWLRGVRLSDKTAELIDYCCSRSTSGLYTIKHSLQQRLGGCLKASTRLIPRIQVEIRLHCMKSVTVSHHAVPATKTVERLAADAVREVNLVAARCKRASLAYCRALDTHSKSGALDGKVFDVWMQCLIRRNAYTAKETTSYEGQELLGNQPSGVELRLVVLARHPDL